MSYRFKPLVREPELPTSELYFSHSMASYIGALNDPSKPIAAISPNAFFARGANGNFLIVFRNFSNAVRAACSELPHHKLIYLLDDDLGAGLFDAFLPVDYRIRLAQAYFKAKKLMRAADHIIVSSQALANAIASQGNKVHVLEPAMIGPAASLDHFCHESTIELTCTGTRSHLADFQSISSALIRILNRYEHVRLTTFFGRHFNPRQTHPRLMNLEPMSWLSFRKFLIEQRVHIALIVAQETRFNSGRSINKLLEAALLGAAPVVSGAAPFANRIAHFPEKPFSPEDPKALVRVLSRMIDQLDMCRDMAKSNITYVNSLNGVRIQRDFWTDLLGLSPD